MLTWTDPEDTELSEPDPEGHIPQDPTPKRSPEESRPHRQRGEGGSRGWGRGGESVLHGDRVSV